MTVTSQHIDTWLRTKENEHLEFKEAKQNFHFEKLVKYCAALANEGGGSIVLGVTDKQPRRVVGTKSFQKIERTKAGLVEKLRLRIDAHEVGHPDGRVLVFTAPGRPIGTPVAVEGAYWMRAGEDLVPMTPDMLRRIFDEAGPDFSAEICEKATPADLDAAAIEEFRRRWIQTSGNEALAPPSAEQLLNDADLLVDGGVTYAALILLGKPKALARHLAQAEVVFEYRSSQAPGPAAQREEYRMGFLAFADRLWQAIDQRNDEQHYQEGFVMHAIDTFREGSVREAILNAISHRDYRHPGSVFVRQFPRHLEVVSPGGLPPGITPENIIDKQFPRNRRIAETLLRCGMVERAGQGANRMLVEAIRDGKRIPDYTRSDEHEVFLRLNGEVEDPSFVKFLSRVEETRDLALSSHEYLVLDLVRGGAPVPAEHREELKSLRGEGWIVSTGRGRGARLTLAPELYETTGRAALLPRAEIKEAVFAHVASRGAAGISAGEILEDFPELSRDRLKSILKELKAEGRLHSTGKTKGVRWSVEASNP